MSAAEISSEANVVVDVDLSALRWNFRTIAAAARPARVAAVVKADAYGLSAALVAPALAACGCGDFFVADPGEARRLRPLLSQDARIYVLGGLPPGHGAALADLGVLPVLNSRAQIDEWAALARARGERLAAAVQADSGMSRLGLSPEEVQALADAPEAFDGVEISLVMSHLACADEAEHAANLQQLARFEALAGRLPSAPRAIANSSAAFLGQRYRGDLVRAGLGLYGGDLGAHAPPMRPVVGVRARVLQTRTVPDGAGVGYGLAHRTRGERRLATVGIGYADGWPRCLTGGGALFAGPHRAPIMGRVSMDSTIVDITGLPDDAVQEGGWLEAIGPRQPLEAVAAAAGTIAYELLTQLSRRAHRTVHDITGASRGAPGRRVACA